MINKMINASKFVFMNLKDYKGNKPKKIEKLDEFFLEKLDILVKNCTDSFKEYEYSKAKQEVERFFWSDFCDNYLEIVKKRVYQGEGNAKLSAQYTLYHSLLTILKLVAPIMPFITEEIYQEYFKKNEKAKSMHIISWPEIEKLENKNQIKILDKLYDLLYQVRQEKSKNKKAMNAEIVLTLGKEDYEEIKSVLEDLKNVVNAKAIREGKNFEVEFL
jgi:valyl-tRNA synthetase